MAEDRITTTGSASILEMRKICKRFGATVALQDVSFALRSGEVHALVGENGAGKSTLVKVLSGVHVPDSGDMLLHGRPFRPRHALEARQQGVGMIYQELSLVPHLSVAENILLGVEPARWGFLRRTTMHERARGALARLGHAELDPATPVRNLSLSEQQLVEIARALAVGCEILVLDEPTSSLSQQDIQRLFAIIRELRDAGLAIIYISHFLEEVQQVADRVTVLRDGGVVGTREIGSVRAAEIVQMMVGREIRDLYPRSARTRGEAVLEIDGLSGMHKPQHATLTLHRGEVMGICGLVGAGRTELLRAVFGLEPVRRGRIKVGAYFGPASPVQRWRQGAGLLSENRKEEGLALALSLADNMTLSNLESFGPAFLLFPRKQSAAAKKWIAALDIRCRGPEQRLVDLSGGNQQKVALARLLQHNVDILLLDEPTRGIDVAAKAKIYQVIDAVASGAGRQPAAAVLMVSSYLPELLGVCDRIAVMYRGRLGPARPAAELDEHSLMLEATGKTAIA